MVQAGRAGPDERKPWQHVDRLIAAAVAAARGVQLPQLCSRPLLPSPACTASRCFRLEGRQRDVAVQVGTALAACLLCCPRLLPPPRLVALCFVLRSLAGSAGAPCRPLAGQRSRAQRERRSIKGDSAGRCGTGARTLHAARSFAVGCVAGHGAALRLPPAVVKWAAVQLNGAAKSLCPTVGSMRQAAHSGGGARRGGPTREAWQAL